MYRVVSLYRCIAMYRNVSQCNKGMYPIQKDVSRAEAVRRRVATIRCIGLEVARVESSELNLGGVADITTGE